MNSFFLFYFIFYDFGLEGFEALIFFGFFGLFFFDFGFNFEVSDNFFYFSFNFRFGNLYFK